MASSLPRFPRFVFTVFEPISLVAGFLGVICDPAWFVAQQIPSKDAVLVTKQSKIVAWQLGNLYLLMAFIGVAIYSSTTEVKVIKSYLFALWLADIGHVGFSCYGLGLEKSLNIAGWNAMAWGNIAATVFLFLTRSAYFMGLFGPHRVPAAKTKRMS